MIKLKKTEPARKPTPFLSLKHCFIILGNVCDNYLYTNKTIFSPNSLIR